MEKHLTMSVGALVAPASKPKERPKRVYVRVSDAGEGLDYTLRPPPGETRKEWVEQLRRALGTTSNSFVDASLRRIMAACCLPNQSWPTSMSVSAAIALIESLEPENEVQAALAVSAACFHAAATRVLGLFARQLSGERAAVSASAAAKLERAFHSALDTFHRIKHGNRQVIRVERLEIQPGGQAVVGQVVSRGRMD